MKNKNTPEIDLLLLACSEDISGIKNFISSNNIDWRSLYQYAAFNEIRPFVYQVFKQIAQTDVDFLQKLQKYQQQLMLENLAKYQEVKRLMRVFDENQLPVIFFKGTIWAEQIFGNIGHRETGDIDLMVRANDVPRCKILLEKEQYFLDKHNQVLWNHYGDAIITKPIYCETTFNKVGNLQYQIDLHWKHSTELAANVRFDDIVDGDKKILSDEMLVVYIVLHHGMKDLWGKLKYLVDLAHCLKNKDLNWEFITQKMIEFDCLKIGIIGFMLCKEYLGVTLPEGLKIANVNVDYAHWNKRIMKNYALKKLSHLKYYEIIGISFSLGSKRYFFRKILTYFRFNFEPFMYNNRLVLLKRPFGIFYPILKIYYKIGDFLKAK